jgi:hypothetical protein
MLLATCDQQKTAKSFASIIRHAEVACPRFLLTGNFGTGDFFERLLRDS